jgi:hypothetical protein
VRREYLNFLECVAHLYIDGRFGSGTANLCRDTLSNSIAAIEIDEDMRGLFKDSVTSIDTFVYLAKFRRKHRPIIEQRKAIFREVAAEGRC